MTKKFFTYGAIVGVLLFTGVVVGEAIRLQMLLFLTMAVSSFLMFSFYNLTSQKNSLYLFFGFYLLTNLPLIIAKTPSISVDLSSLTHYCFLYLGLIATPILFLSFSLELFNAPKFAKKGSLILLGISLTAVFLWITQINFSLKETSEDLKNMTFYLNQIGLFIYLTTAVIAVVKRFIENNSPNPNISPIDNYFLILLVPFISGKLLESLVLIDNINNSTNWIINHASHHTSLYLLFITPFIVANISYNYFRSQKTELSNVNYRVKILELLEKTSKDVPRENVLISVIEALCKSVNAKRGSISLLNEGNFLVKATYGISDMSIYNQVLGKQSQQMKDLLNNDDHLNIRDINKSIIKMVHRDGARYKSNSAMFFKLQNAISNFGVIMINDPLDNQAFSNEQFELIKTMLPNISRYLENKQIIESLDIQFEGIITAFAETINRKSAYTKFHSLGVITTLEALTDKMNIPFTRDLRTSALLHDLGKVFIPDYILDKPGRLNKREMDEVKTHPMHTGKILANIPGFESIAQWASMHHEAFDGSGYPFAIKGENIPFEAQLINAADYIDALATNRPYRDRLTFDAIIQIVDENTDKFNPVIKEAMIRLLKDKSFRTHYDLKSSDFKPKESVDELKIKFIIERIKGMHEALESIVNIMPKELNKQTVSFETQHLLSANMERFNGLYTQIEREINNLQESDSKVVSMKAS